VFAAIVALVGRHVADRAVAMLRVVPIDEARDPGAGCMRRRSSCDRLGEFLRGSCI
jgi:hypothetical protein